MPIEWPFPFGVVDSLAVLLHALVIGLTVIILVKSAHRVAADRDLGWRLFVFPFWLINVSFVTIVASVLPGSGLGVVAQVLIACSSVLGVVMFWVIATSGTKEP
jgi:hypothetical protein